MFEIIFSLKFAFGVIVGLAAFSIRASMQKNQREKKEAECEKQRAQHERQKSEQKKWFEGQDVKNPENQLKFIDKVTFRSKKLMNKKEYPVFAKIEKHLRNKKSGHRIMAQVNMGEFIGTIGDGYWQDKAFSSINSKRVDFLIIGPWGYPLIAIEYQGSGHYQNDATKRDKVKRMAAEKTDIYFLEIFPGDTPEQYLAEIELVLDGKSINPNEENDTVNSQSK
ncbi:MAG: DUF2726 domain-containing protein [Robiginitomaculum sp.]|nr:DUF2726 domain-containing protein [Robiginitomaculum sp.]